MFLLQDNDNVYFVLDKFIAVTYIRTKRRKIMEQINDTNFQSEVLNADKLVLVDFFATWCGPCRQMLPVMEELSSELGSQVKIVKMDVDEAPKTPDMFDIQSIPTMILFKNGQMVDKKLGAQSKADVAGWIKSHL